MNLKKYIELSREAARIISTRFFNNLTEQQKERFRYDILAFGNGDQLSNFVVNIIENGNNELNKEKSNDSKTTRKTK